MMKFKKTTVLFVTFVLVHMFCICSFASQPELPDDFMDRSVEQRIQWLDANIPQVTEDVVPANSQRNIVTDYSSTKQNYYFNESGAKVVGISVTYNWRANLDDTIEYYSVSDFSTYIYDTSYVFIDVNAP